jgi:hypothetical protein
MKQIERNDFSVGQLQTAGPLVLEALRQWAGCLPFRFWQVGRLSSGELPDQRWARPEGVRRPWGSTNGLEEAQA